MGVGKTTLGNALSQKLGYRHLDFDVVTQSISTEFHKKNPHLSEGEALKKLKPARYNLLKETITASHKHEPLIVSAPLRSQIRSMEAWKQWTKGIPNTLLFWLFLDKDILIKRIIQRGAARNRDYIYSPVPTPNALHIPLDASQSVAELVNIVLRKITTV
jgi:adenylate kinase family enzyme